MKAVIQRVRRASVSVDGNIHSAIDGGLLILLGVAQGDDEKDAEVLSSKIVNLRIFEDEQSKMNLSLLDIGGETLTVSQFTLLADCSRGRRPDFFGAEKPQRANELYLYFCERINALGAAKAEKGVFGADMLISLENDGPVTITLDSKELR